MIRRPPHSVEIYEHVGPSECAKLNRGLHKSILIIADRYKYMAHRTRGHIERNSARRFDRERERERKEERDVLKCRFSHVVVQIAREQILASTCEQFTAAIV